MKCMISQYNAHVHEVWLRRDMMYEDDDDDDDKNNTADCIIDIMMSFCIDIIKMSNHQGVFLFDSATDKILQLQW